ncbi:MAG: ROK family protein [Oscillospiraceae bacterium]|nr:ROK family protein [Oscillospiraceae bacterium]
MNKLFLGYDIGGTKINMRVESSDSSFFKQKRIASSSDFNSIYDDTLSFLHENGINESDIAGCGCGVPGCVAKDGVTVSVAPALGWENISLYDAFFSKFKFPCYALNDVSASLYAEISSGSLKGCQDALFISAGTGLGSAILSDGAVISGHNGSAGEIGYFIEEAEARESLRFSSSTFGACENKLSGTALNDFAVKIGTDSRGLFSQYMKNNKAREIVDTYVLRLSVLIANCSSLLNPEKVVIGGGVSESLGGFIGVISETVGRLTPIKSEVIITKLKNDAGAIGACAYAKIRNVNK